MRCTEDNKKVQRFSLHRKRPRTLISCLSEFAKSIYANISHEKRDLLRYLKRNDELRMMEQEQVQEAFQARIQVSSQTKRQSRY
jgi:tellurite resistance protein